MQAIVFREEPSPPIQQQVECPTSGFRVTEPFQPANFRFPKKLCGKQNRAYQSKWFLEFRWLPYNEQNNSVFCFICVQQNAKLNLRAARNNELAIISEGFSNWKKALLRFKEHQLSDCHKLAIDYQMNFPTTCGNVLEMFNNAAKKTMESNRICFIKVIECLQYIARQGLAMQGDTDDESNFIQLLKLRGKDRPLLIKWLERKEDKYTSHEIQNEIIAIMANYVIRDLVLEIRGGFFSIICDEYTDIRNKEQLTICIRWVDDQLEAHEDRCGDNSFSCKRCVTESTVTISEL